MIFLDSRFLNLKQTFWYDSANKLEKEWDQSVKNIQHFSLKKKIMPARIVAWIQVATTPTSSQYQLSESLKFPKENSNFLTNLQHQANITSWDKDWVKLSEPLLLISAEKREMDLLSANNTFRKYWVSSMFIWDKWWKKLWMKLWITRLTGYMKIWCLDMSIIEQPGNKL